MPDNAAGLVYGTILVATLLSAESAVRETYVKTVIGVLVALATYWLALAYARFTGERLQDGTKATVAGMASAAAHELTVLYGAAVPFVALIAFWIGGASLNTAVIGAVYFADGADGQGAHRAGGDRRGPGRARPRAAPPPPLIVLDANVGPAPRPRIAAARADREHHRRHHRPRHGQDHRVRAQAR